MSKRFLEFEVQNSEMLKNIPNTYYGLVNKSFENPKKVFNISSGVGKYHEPFTPLGSKKDFISYSAESDGFLTINAQFYKSPKENKAILKIHLFSNSGEEKLNSFIKNFKDGFEKLHKNDSTSIKG